uniref:Uncharacterized protein n=1 Tax=Trypanosoma brucei brucei (strain 927/4 GUTat10.1) TaxID=185431 RepID=Q4FKN9_TRYB2|nr:hypothetical protein Tb10.v4.0051 [Trypanosoma brucei brucei TREU927]
MTGDSGFAFIHLFAAKTFVCLLCLLLFPFAAYILYFSLLYLCLSAFQDVSGVYVWSTSHTWHTACGTIVTCGEFVTTVFLLASSFAALYILLKFLEGFVGCVLAVVPSGRILYHKRDIDRRYYTHVLLVAPPLVQLVHFQEHTDVFSSCEVLPVPLAKPLP